MVDCTHAVVFVLSRFPLSQPFYFFGKAWYGAKLAAVAFIVLLLFAFGDYWLLQSTLWIWGDVYAICSRCMMRCQLW